MDLKSFDFAHRDKYLHGLAGLVIALVVGFLHPALGLLACALAAWAKEEYDRRGHGVKDGWDAYATLLGAVPAQLFLWMLA
jgi:hypothetical protein